MATAVTCKAGSLSSVKSANRTPIWYRLQPLGACIVCTEMHLVKSEDVDLSRIVGCSLLHAAITNIN